ncbi:hypothetical protein QFW82_46640 [Streptomyces malaysiensis subsp. malaysiensis]|nr:hypothetical protein [Streptomyces sp. NA07423]WHX23974.1 hypothetical protein QFW82_46640 [Streptomyces sp. NA07423]
MPLLDDADFRTHYLERTPPVGVPLPGTELHLESARSGSQHPI